MEYLNKYEYISVKGKIKENKFKNTMKIVSHIFKGV